MQLMDDLKEGILGTERRSNYMAPCGELAMEEAMDLP